MSKRETYVYGRSFWDFYDAQTKKVQTKIDWVIGLVRTLPVVPEKFLRLPKKSSGAKRLQKRYYDERKKDQ